METKFCRRLAANAGSSLLDRCLRSFLLFFFGFGIVDVLLRLFDGGPVRGDALGVLVALCDFLWRETKALSNDFPISCDDFQLEIQKIIPYEVKK